MSSGTETRPAAEAQVGDRLPAISIPLTFERVAMTPFSTWDFFPGHHNPEFARAQGLRDIYLNTIALQGFADRLVMEWAGSHSMIVRRQMKMRQPAHPGDTLHITGVVTERVALADGRTHIGMAISLDTESGQVCDVTTLIYLPNQNEGTVDE